MNAIEAMQAEIEYQLQDLQKQDLLPLDSNCLFVGSGDSYIAGLTAQYASAGRALCCHPTDLIQNPAMADDRSVYVVSISGKTKANILAARVAKRRGIRTTAITTRPTSALARACDQTTELKYRSAGITTAGTIGFTSSMLTCISIATNMQLPANIDRIYRHAEKRADQIADKIDKGTYFILGDGILYPASIYAALKFNEVFGAKAIAHPAEEFCHSPLFSLKKDDQVIVMGSSGQLNRRLGRDGFSSVHVDFKGTGIGLLLQSIFFVQLLVLKLAQRRGLTNCYFLRNKKLLKASSDFIYG